MSSPRRILAAPLLLCLVCSIGLAQSYSGWVDGADCGSIYGWAWDATQPNTPITVDLYARGGAFDNVPVAPLATIQAANFRQDLVNAGIGNGYHGFSFPIPTYLKDGTPHYIDVRYGGTTINLGYSDHWVVNCPAVATGYQYYYSDALTSMSANWKLNGSGSMSSSGFTSGSSGALVSQVAAPDGSSYEVRSTQTLVASGGYYIQYLRASPDALNAVTSQTGTFYAAELLNPSVSGNSCSAQFAIIKSVSGNVTLMYYNGAVPCRNGMTMRTVMLPSGTIQVYFFLPAQPSPAFTTAWTDTAITSGQAGIGVYGAPAGNTISSVKLGPLDRVAPGGINAQSGGVSAFPSRVDIHWQGAADDPNGIGVYGYNVYRNGTYLQSASNPGFSDAAVSPSSRYTYTVYPQDFHNNSGPPASFTVDTPPAGSIDPRQVGVRPTGAYWGAAGEQIDVRSGNLNYTVPLLRALGRGGWSVPFNLTYNSQVARQDSAGVWNLGEDVGYGYGWRLLAGSLTPYWQDVYTVHHWLFTDSTGAEYRLDQNSNGVWSSRESLYVWYDSNSQRLYFRDGSFWIFNCTSAGPEPDAGTRYPTLMEDSNGNTITVHYYPSEGSLSFDTSSRIRQIDDARGSWGGPTYEFNFNTELLPHLTSIVNEIQSGENYTFSIPTEPIGSAFNQVSYGTAGVLRGIRSGPGLTTQFDYHRLTDQLTNSGILRSVALPHGATIEWNYRTATYPGSVTLYEVVTRFLTKSAGETHQAYDFLYDAQSSATPVHAWTCINDPDGKGQKCWQFQTDPAQNGFGLASFLEHRPAPWPNIAGSLHEDYTWAANPTGNLYIGTVLTTEDMQNPGQTQTKTVQTLDPYGNVTQAQMFDYGNLAVPARVYTNTYLTSSPYTSRYIFNRLVTSTVAPTVNPYDPNGLVLIRNLYDGVNFDPPQAYTPQHDPAYDATITARGNIIEQTRNGKPTWYTYDIAGVVTKTGDGRFSAAFSPTVNNIAPAVVTPNGNANLSDHYTYNAAVQVTAFTAPNNAQATTTYDVYGRPTQSTSPYGAVTTYGYSYYVPGSQALTTETATVNGRWTRKTLDGLGREIKTETGNGSTTVSVVETIYDSCGCSPIGKLKQVSEPHAPGAQALWTLYTYDGRGRTLSIQKPDGSLTRYAYAGNTVTVTDPAGRWKKFTTDAFGNLTRVTEPNPAGGGDLVTSYTYSLRNQLTGVSMPRGATTQTRTFVYDAGGRLASATNPENGVTRYTYNGDNTVATRTDANGTLTTYSYDAYQRVTRILYGSDANDITKRVDFNYDTGGANTWGRLASQVFTTKAPHDNYSYYTWTQSYGYAPGGAVTSKNLQASWWWVTNSNQYAAQMAVSYAYDNEGRVSSVTYPNAYWNGDPFTGPTYQYTYDAMGRPGGMTKQGNGTALVSGVQYGAAGELTQMQYAGYSETRSYNSLFQLTGIVVDQGAIHLANFGYTYPSGANNGQISRYNDNVSGEEVSYQYDALNRLISAQTTSASWGLSFSYDGYGNLTDKTVTKGSAVSLHAAVDPSTNRFSGYSYDANGNLLRYGADTYTYDAENRLSTVTTGDRRVYSPDNKWMATMSAQGPGGSIRFYGAYGELIGDYGLGIWTYPITVQFVASDWYAYFGGRRIVKSTPYGDTPVVLDRLGSARNNGAAYFPYGETRQGGTTNAYQFATYFRDTSNLDYADQRYYSSQLGRFLTPDPGGIATANPADPQSWNRYAYVQGDPVNYYDAGGLFRHKADPGPLSPSAGNGQAVSGEGHGSMFYLAVDLSGNDMEAVSRGAAKPDSIVNAGEAKQGTLDALARFTNCQKLFGGATKVRSYVNTMTFLDGRQGGNMNAAGGTLNQSFADYHAQYPSNWADTLSDANGNVSKMVVLWADFFGNVAEGYPTPLVEQEATLVHEFIHSFFNLAGADSGITNRFHIPVARGQSYSDAVDSWIKSDCGRK